MAAPGCWNVLNVHVQLLVGKSARPGFPLEHWLARLHSALTGVWPWGYKEPTALIRQKSLACGFYCKALPNPCAFGGMVQHFPRMVGVRSWAPGTTPCSQSFWGLKRGQQAMRAKERPAGQPLSPECPVGTWKE